MVDPGNSGEARISLASGAFCRPSALVGMGLAGYTPYAALFNSLTTIQLHEQPLESHAAQTILQYTDECK
jgi:hypothetical protein